MKLLATLALLVILAAEACAHIHDAVCKVWCQPYGGSGTLIGVTKDGRGLVLTAAHVIEEGNRGAITCEFPKGNQKSRATILGEDKAYDLAALAITAPKDIETPRVTTARKEDGPFTAVGYPYYTQGQLRFVRGAWMGFPGRGTSAWAPSMLHTRCTVVSGYSGGARFNRYGEYAGLVSGMTGDSPGSMDRCWGAGGPALTKFVARWLKQDKQPEADKPQATPAKQAASYLIDMPSEYRELNTDGSCGYIAVANCMRFCGRWREADRFRRRYGQSCTDDSLKRALDESGIKYAASYNNREFLTKSVECGRGAAVFYGGAHVVNFVGCDGENVTLMGNQASGVKENRTETWEEFMRNHRASGGFEVMILDGAPPKPE